MDISHPITSKRIRQSTKLTTKKEAEQFQIDFISELKGYKSPDLSIKKNANHSYDEAKERWFKEKFYKKSIDWDKKMFKRLDRYFSNKHLRELDKHTIKLALDDIAKTSSYSTANRHRAILLAMLNIAEKEWEWISKAPKIPPYKEPKHRIRYLTPIQVNNLTNELPRHLGLMVKFSVHTGLRQSNVKNLKWEQVDLKRKTSTYSYEDTKNSKPLSISLHKEAINILQSLKGTHDVYVFSYKGNAPIVNITTKAWYKALKRCNIEDFRWHDLRHTWASWHVQNGTPLAVLKELGGWSSLSMVMKYAHLGQNHLAEYANNI